MATGRKKSTKRAASAAGRVSARRAGSPALLSLVAIWAALELGQVVDELVGLALVESPHGEGRDLAAHAAGEREGGRALVAGAVEDHAEVVRAHGQVDVVDLVARPHRLDRLLGLLAALGVVLDALDPVRGEVHQADVGGHGGVTPPVLKNEAAGCVRA